MDRYHFYEEGKGSTRRIEAHLLEEDDFTCEESGIVSPNIFERKQASVLHYVIELDGVESKDDIGIKLEAGDILHIEATPSKEIFYHSLSKKVPVKKYRARIQVLLDIDTEDVTAKYQETEEVLRITIKKPEKAKTIEIE